MVPPILGHLSTSNLHPSLSTNFLAIGRPVSPVDILILQLALGPETVVVVVVVLVVVMLLEEEGGGLLSNSTPRPLSLTCGMYVCMYVCMYVWGGCVSACVYVCMGVCVCVVVCMYVCM